MGWHQPSWLPSGDLGFKSQPEESRVTGRKQEGFAIRDFQFLPCKMCVMPQPSRILWRLNKIVHVKYHWSLDTWLFNVCEFLSHTFPVYLPSKPHPLIHVFIPCCLLWVGGTQVFTQDRGWSTGMVTILGELLPLSEFIKSKSLGSCQLNHTQEKKISWHGVFKTHFLNQRVEGKIRQNQN
jgi:hypothetical protein